jgi:hypothetical protein
LHHSLLAWVIPRPKSKCFGSMANQLSIASLYLGIEDMIVKETIGIETF